MTIPIEVLDYLAGMTRVQFNDDGTLAMLHAPGSRDIAEHLHAAGGKTLTEDIDAIGAAVDARIFELLPKWQLAYTKLSREPRSEKAKRELPEGVARFFAPKTTPEGQEARIKGMKLEELLRWVDANGLQVERHASNNGLTSMRSRNALYAMLRKTGKLIEP